MSDRWSFAKAKPRRVWVAVGETLGARRRPGNGPALSKHSDGRRLGTSEGNMTAWLDTTPPRSTSTLSTTPPPLVPHPAAPPRGVIYTLRLTAAWCNLWLHHHHHPQLLKYPNKKWVHHKEIHHLDMFVSICCSPWHYLTLWFHWRVNTIFMYDHSCASLNQPSWALRPRGIICQSVNRSDPRRRSWSPEDLRCWLWLSSFSVFSVCLLPFIAVFIDKSTSGVNCFTWLLGWPSDPMFSIFRLSVVADRINVPLLVWCSRVTRGTCLRELHRPSTMQKHTACTWLKFVQWGAAALGFKNAPTWDLIWELNSPQCFRRCFRREWSHADAEYLNYIRFYSVFSRIQRQQSTLDTPDSHQVARF